MAMETVLILCKIRKYYEQDCWWLKTKAKEELCYTEDGNFPGISKSLRDNLACWLGLVFLSIHDL